MCGISGIYNCFNKDINPKQIIKKITKIQNSRGPDGNAMWTSDCKKITFGHNRLSIIDLSDKARQPFVSKDKNFIITFNGEIYNYKEIKKELTHKDILFRSNSDTEVIVEAYKYWGLESLKKFRGMFSFALWDVQKHKLILARDPLGIKPLYYININSVIYFASQIKSLLSIDGINFKKNETSIVSFYLWGNIQDPSTLYSDINSVEKGTCKIINENGTEKTFVYNNLKDLFLNSEPITFNNKIDEADYLKSIVDETVKSHQVADVPVNFLLSSGIDSSILVASINDEDKKNCSSLTLDFNHGNVDDETFLAKKTANKNNILHKIKKLRSDEIKFIIEEFFKNMDSPTNDGLNNFIISYLAKKDNTKVLISGVGGDELFSGYPSFKRIPQMNNILKYFPDTNFINDLFKKKMQNLLKKRLNTKYLSIFRYGREVNTAFLLQRSLFLPEELHDFLQPNVIKNGLEELNTLNNTNQDIKDIKDKKLAIMYLEIKYYLCSKLLRDIDWASMAHSIEMRTPFVDIFFYKKLIPLIKSNLKINKSNLLNCYKDNLPEELFKRKKTGFAIPHKYFLEKFYNRESKYSRPIRDWSILSFEKYLHNEKKN